MKITRILIVKEPYASRLVDGTKKTEYRRFNTNVRGYVGICASGTGKIIGVVELYDTKPKEDYWGWKVRNARRLEKPVRVKRKYGAIIWQKVNRDL